MTMFSIISIVGSSEDDRVSVTETVLSLRID